MTSYSHLTDRELEGLYIVVNLGFVFLFTWLYLEGGAKLKAAMRRLRKRHEEEEEELVEAARSRA